MTENQIALIKATVPVLRENGVLLTSYFYNRMFQHNPELKHVFNMGNQQSGKQQTALAMAVLAYAENIENPSVLLGVVDHIGHKHTSLDIRPEHYQIVGNHLISSIKEVLGDAATDELLEAWTLAYSQLADIMSGHENALYRAKVNRPGGWTGWRPFEVRDKVMESQEITSFYLYPTDQGDIAAHLPGQYISVRLFLPELNLIQPRQYSISSSSNGKFYRISVKKEKGSKHPDGMISNRLHDHIQVGDKIELSSPSGNFVLNQKETDNPQVFISGGIGQTPLLAMLEELILNKNSTQPIVWVHGCRNEQVHAFKDRLQELSAINPSLQNHLFYEQLEKESADATSGVVNLEEIQDKVLLNGANYYLCGPAGFIRKHYEFLKDAGVDTEAIHFEEFGPASLSLN